MTEDFLGSHDAAMGLEKEKNDSLPPKGELIVYP